MKKFFKPFLVLMSVLALSLPAFAQEEEEPIITLKTSAYENMGTSNQISILIGGIKSGYIDVDCGAGKFEVELERAEYDSDSAAWTGSFVPCTVTSAGIIKIYGDAANIDVLNASGCYIQELDITKLTNMTILDLSHNELEELNLDPLTNIQYLDLSDNPFTKTPLKVGNKPYLTVLDIGRMQGLDESFDLKNYPELMTFDAWANAALKDVDPSGCPKLRKISIDSTPVKSLDVSQNAQLQVLNISDTGISSLDLSNNAELLELYCDHMSSSVNSDAKFKTLDISHNPKLIYLFASGNELTEIDVTNNIYLQDLHLNYNKLTNIDLSKNVNLNNVMLRYNYFTFATLPFMGEWNDYGYIQNPMQVAKSQKEGSVLDLSDKVLREGTETTCVLYQVKDTEPGILYPLDEEYYTYADGKVTLHKALADSVYLAFSNDAFPLTEVATQALNTTKFKVKTAEDFGKDDLALTFKVIASSTSPKEVAFNFAMEGATPENPKPFYVYFDGTTKETFYATSSELSATPNVTGSTTGTVQVYVPQDEVATALSIEGFRIVNIDLTGMMQLRDLRLVDTKLYALDMGWNNLLRKLEVTGNSLTTLDLSGANEAYHKNLLSDINLSNNGITNLELHTVFAIKNLDLSNNNLSEVSFKEGDNIRTLNLSNNKFTTLSFTNCESLTDLNVSGNKLTEITFPTTNNISKFDCSNNDFTFANMPDMTALGDNFIYAPQNDITIAKIGPGVDLSNQNLADSPATFAWYNVEDNTALTKDVDYTEVGGKTRFKSPIFGKNVRGVVTNPAYPNLTLGTTAIEAADMPTIALASFTTTADAQATLLMVAKAPETPIYIDWKGDAVELVQYLVGTTPTTFTVNSYAGANAKVYAYDNDCVLTVFSINGVPMSSLDVSKLTSLSTLTVKDAGLDNIVFPTTETLAEINLEGNNYSAIDLTQYPNLRSLCLNANKFKTFDSSVYPNLECLYLSTNGLTSVKLDNAKLWTLAADHNELTSVDLSKLPALDQLALAHNELETIDLSNNPGIHAMALDANRFKFSTLPLPKAQYGYYTYGKQAQLNPPTDGITVDLSTEAMVDTVATKYQWFVDEYYYDDYGNITGEYLYINQEYTLENGVTTFLRPNKNILCVMTNTLFPNLVLTTPLMDVIGNGGVEDLEQAKIAVKAVGRDVYITATDGDVYLYSMNGALVRKSAVVGGQCTLRGIEPGAYVAKVGKYAYKFIIK